MSAPLTLRLPPASRAALIGSSLAINTLMLALPIATLQIYDRVLTHPDSGTLPMLATGVVIAVVMEALLRLVRAWLTGSAAHAYEKNASEQLLAHVLGSWVGPAQQRHHSEYLQALSALGRMKDYALQRLIAISVDIPYMLLFLAILALIGGVLVVVPLVAVGLFGLLVVRWGMKLRAAITDRNAQDEIRYGFMLESMAGAHVMKSLGIEPRFIEKYQQLQQPVSRSGFAIAMLNHTLANGAAMFSQLMVVLVVACGAPLVMNGTISMGGLIACVLLSGRLIQPLQHALACWMSHQEFETAREQTERLRALPLQPMASGTEYSEHDGHVAIERLSYGYQHELNPILNEVTLYVQSNEILGISGETGSGRTTLLKLIAGLIPPASGTVRISGMDPAQLMPSALSQHIAYLTSDAVLFRGTLMQNLSGFDPDLQARAIELSKLIGLDALIAQLPAGYDTQLEGSPADVIPPGLRQRVALVRALRHKPKLILYDQADRSLDRDGYHQLFSLLARLKGKATMLLVSDDKNLLRLADRRIVLHSGGLHPLGNEGARGGLSLVGAA